MIDHHEALDRKFHALSEAARRQMLERLSHGPASVSELARPLPTTLAAALQHVQVLQRAGLVRTRKVGRSRICELEAAGLAQVESWLGARRALWEGRFDRLGQVLGEDEEP